MRAVNYASLFFFAALIFIILIWNKAHADVGSTALKSKFITVLVIDTGADTKHELFKDRNIICPHQSDCADFWGHGTHVTSLVLNGPLDAHNKPTSKVCNRVILHSCDYKPKTGFSGGLQECLKYAAWLKPDFVNFSSVGSDFSLDEYTIYASLPNTTFVVAAGNEGDNLVNTPSFPAIYPNIANIAPKFNVPSLTNVITVGARTSEGGKWSRSNYASFVKYEIGVNVKSAAPNSEYAYMSGTSQATAIHTNKLIREKCNEL